MKRVLHYMRKYWYLYFFGSIALLSSIVLDLFTPMITGTIIDDVIEGGNISIFKGLITALIGITLGRAVLGYIKEIMFDFAGSNIICGLRQDLFDHIQSLSLGFFDRKNTGELMSRIKDDADRVWEGISFGLMLFIEIIIYFVIATIFMFRISAKLSVLAFLTLPFIAYMAIMLEKKIGATYEKISEQNATLNTTAQENIAGIRLVKAFARERHEIKKFLAHNEGYYKLNMEQARIWSRFFPSIEMLTNILPILVIVFGGSMVIGEDLTVGTLVKFTGYMNMVIWPMRSFGFLSNLMAEAKASAKKIDKIFVEEPEIKNANKPAKLDEPKGKVEFNNVSLELDGKKVLDDINFKILPSKTLAIMGATGSGKTSIINLLERFYDTTDGEILIDNERINDIELANLRENISVVMQDVFLFSDTIKENISFGYGELLANDVIINSAQSAKADDFIEHMEDGYDTVIGERGIGLSGGQKQRISIARALAKECKIIIFDDSTSALDMKTEHRIQKEIDKKDDITKIIVAHRISAVKNADEIIILEDGKIVERGNHDSLIKMKGRYYDTLKEQYEGYAV
ncbi:ABC transporter ATP-binding protein [Vallitalea guaymasensis]|uniref:ABC transporter ATP-binding protein n=1 Tax=Vallitalea guaymasensis TaxID=1185412 RepID=A0A8J8MB94_9FIRM|nr:ABC transporter ATP-binding protein [Vallitalea guaymasensis]QUH29535.1 ABC transporter ATP-binding protein [Vallitalea guaymasensis]